MKQPSLSVIKFSASLASLVLVSGLTGCGGKTSPEAVNSSEQTGAVPAVVTLNLTPAVLPGDVVAQPTFHVAPVILKTPPIEDAFNPTPRGASRQSVPAHMEGIASRGLTLDVLRSMGAYTVEAENGAVPMSSTATVVTTYTPAQIRGAYSLPGLPPNASSVTSTSAAAMGAGQTIYIVDAYADSNIVAELAAFNSQFGLPSCTTTTLTAASALPLASAGTTGCQFVIAYGTASGELTSSAPTYNSGWATETALDVEWAHATAPYARIVLIELSDATLPSLTGGIDLANNMGLGTVSMSFGAGEGTWTAGLDSNFNRLNMTYFASTGDSGMGVNWPSVSQYVTAVGGTSLTYSGQGNRSEVAWSDTGGGISGYTPAPSYQASAVPGMGLQTFRNVADVSFNADPYTGQYVATMTQGSSSVGWVSAGGTSLSTPQWAGIMAIAKAQAQLKGNVLIEALNPVLYGTIASTISYGSAFADITQGADGTCATCAAKSGYDAVTGLGTPNVSNFFSVLANSGVPATVASAPVVTPASISGVYGKALTFTVAVTSADAVTYTLTGAPTGMSISTAGVVTWTVPVSGTYKVTVTATDSKTKLVGSAVFPLTITTPAAPVVSTGSVNGIIATPLSYAVKVTTVDSVTYSLTGAPSGMVITSAGVISWPKPTVGSYSVTVTATDSLTKLTGKGVIAVGIANKAPPAVTGGTVTGYAGTALTFSVPFTAPDSVTFTMTGAQAGMTISTAGVLTWAKPVAGIYSVTVKASDAITGESGSAVYSITVDSASPIISAPAITGTAGKLLTGTITVTDIAPSISVSIANAPVGMTFKPNGSTVLISWADAVHGKYNLTVTAIDSNKHSSTLVMAVTVN